MYELAAEATNRFEHGRDAVARLVGAPRQGVILTKNASEAINLVAWAWGVRNLRPGDRIVVTEMEHHSNIVPWQIVATITGAEVAFAPVTPGGELDMDAFRRLLSGPVRMVAVAHASNVLGTINPVAEIARMAHDAGALCLVDASQSVPHMPVDAPALGCDFLAFTGHKMLGPTGIGVLVGRRGRAGGHGAVPGRRRDDLRRHHRRLELGELPWKFEAGTPPIAEAVGVGAAAEYLRSVGLDAIRAHEVELTGHLLDALGEVDGITVYGPRDPEARGGAVSFSLPDIHPHDIAQLIDREGVCVRAGHHCAKPLMRVLGVGATARASTYLYNSHDDIDTLVRALGNARAMFR